MANKSPSNLIINYLPQTMTDKELFNLFVTVGPIAQCKVMKDYKTGYSFGYGFVTYTNPEDAEKAIQQLNGQEILNKRIKVSYARPAGDDIKETNLYVTNLPRHYTEEDLERVFSVYGTIVSKNLLFDKISGAQRGVAFVRYDRREEAQRAIDSLNGQVPEGARDPLNVRVAEEHGKQKAAQFSGWQPDMNQGRGRGDNFRGMRGFPIRGAMMPPGRGNMRGGYNNEAFNNSLVSYPVRGYGGFGPLRQDKLQQRFNPMTAGMHSNGNNFF